MLPVSIPKFCRKKSTRWLDRSVLNSDCQKEPIKIPTRSATLVVCPSSMLPTQTRKVGPYPQLGRGRGFTKDSSEVTLVFEHDAIRFWSVIDRLPGARVNTQLNCVYGRET